MANRAKRRYVISVLVKDRVGVLRDISGAVSDMGANIDGISQTVVAGYFTVILTATFDKAREPEEIRAAIEDRFSSSEASVVVRNYDPSAGITRTVAGEGYIVTLIGKDHPGIMKTITYFLASKGINIEDWYVEFHGNDVMHIGEITVPGMLDMKQTQEEFQDALGRFGLTAAIQHENIFRATNEVGPIKSLLDTSHA